MFGSAETVLVLSSDALGKGKHALGTEINHSANVQFLCEAALVSFRGIVQLI